MPPAENPASVPRRYYLALWLLASILACILCLYEMPAAMVDGQFIPADHDSFYHARRIIDAVPDFTRFYQFDPRIHAPEGSWITWPWAYDLLMAVVTRSVMALTGVQQPMAIIAFVAPLWVFVNAWLLLRVAQQLRLSLPLQALVLLAFAVSMLTRALHRVGMVDHHYIEYTFVLATLLLGLRWYQQPGDRRRAARLGVVLGLAPAFHNGDFILQLPVLLSWCGLWLCGVPLDRRAAQAFALALLIATGLAVLPSVPLWQGFFDFTLLSWFHVYVAACTAGLMVLLPRVARRTANIAGLAVLAMLAMLPVLGQLAQGSGFLTGSLEQLGENTEILSLPAFVISGRAWLMTRLFSGLIWLLPAGICWVWWRLRAQLSPERLYLAIYSSFGVALLLFQFRLQYFGAWALWLLPCLWAQAQCQRAPQHARQITGTLAAVMAVALWPGVVTLRLTSVPGNDGAYAQLRPMLLALHQQCARNPGVVLANHDFGHYISYHTDCSVISDNFIITRQHEAKLRQTRELLAASSSALLRQAPWVRYVLVERRDRLGVDRCFPACAANAGLRHELLENSAPANPALQQLGEIQAAVDGVTQPLARLYVVRGR
jgi:hypothetical protein